MPLRKVFDGTKAVSGVSDAYDDRLRRWSDIQEYMPFLREQAASRENAVILELGSRRANSTFAFLSGAEESDSYVWSSDIDNILKYPDGIGPWRNHPRWTFVCGDDMNPEVQEILPKEVDILFIDTSHEYEHTLNECRAYVPRVKPGGIALFHDTHLMGWPGYEWYGEKSPVWTALDDYCAEAGITWEDKEGTYGLGIIQVA